MARKRSRARPDGAAAPEGPAGTPPGAAAQPGGRDDATARTPATRTERPGPFDAEGLRVGGGIALLGLLLTLFVSLSVSANAQDRYIAANGFGAVATGDLVYVKSGATPAPGDLAVCVLDIFSYPSVCRVDERAGDGYRVSYRVDGIENVTQVKEPRVKGVIDPARTVRGGTVANYSTIAAIGLLLVAAGLGTVVAKGLERE